MKISMCNLYSILWGFPVGTVVENLPASAGDEREAGSIPWLGRRSGKRNVNPFQYSRLKNLIDRGTCYATVHGVVKSQTLLITHTKTHTLTSILHTDH